MGDCIRPLARGYSKTGTISRRGEGAETPMIFHVKSAWFGSFILNLASYAVAQDPGGTYWAGGPYGYGIAPHSSGAVAGFGIIAGGYGGGGSASFQPGRSSFGGPWGGFAFNVSNDSLPAGQVGPGGLMLPRFPTSRPRSQTTTTQRRTNLGRAEELTEVGDRSFRGGNYRRAEERYHLATKANPDSPVPHIHLAQVALTRKNYQAAANHLREAVTASRGSGWLLAAPDIQSMYGEPGEFAKQISHLESHLQTQPDDRNAWFVLGAQQYFSGRSQAAADTFTRLSDRAPDEALSVFIDASTVALRTTSKADIAAH